MIIHPDFKDFLQLLDQQKVKYLLVGAYAMALLGYPRNTGDIDIWFENEPGNNDRLLNVLKDFGFGSLNITSNDLSEPGIVIQLGREPVRIDIMNTISGVSFEEAYESHIDFNVDGVPVTCISLDYFKINKKATGRSKDIGDLDRFN
ncbi:MAG: nucleotidyltransferase [Bacteroidales bacterium]